MVQNVQNASTAYPVERRLQSSTATYSASFSASLQITKTDQVSFGGNAVSNDQAQNIVLDRAFEKLRAVVEEARAALGIPEGETIDTSPEATANRIADFALNFFAQFAENNGLADDEAGRSQFAEFIGNAINQGIDEARGILTALSALNGDVETGINDTASYIQNRLDDFVKNGLSIQ